jgi:hypothetical protein
MMEEAILLSEDIKVGRLNRVTKHPLLDPLIEIGCLIHLKKCFLRVSDHLLGVHRCGIMRDLQET